MHFLKERALQFYEQAIFTLERGYCEMTLFNIEQALQLYMKYLLYRKVGDYPKTHFLRDIADRLIEIYQDRCGVKNHVKRWGQTLALLEYAYISSRYLPFRARREDCEAAYQMLKEALEVFQCLENT